MDKTLVVMAAGMGSRYGGNKQIDGMGPHNEALMLYSIYDAVKAGFTKVVFIIKHSFEAQFKAQIGDLVAKKVHVEYAFQELTDLPEGCTVLSNDWGTAPGCAFEAEGVRVVMLPGPPRECREMFTHRALPYLQNLADGTILSRSLRIFGMGESAVESLLRDRMNAMTNPTLAPYAKEGEVELRITAKAGHEQEARALITPVEARLRAQLGSAVYGADVTSLEEVVLPLLKERGLTLGCAESCTGGLIAKRITDLPGASAVFRGSVVSYATPVKHTVLGVPQALLEEYGAVSALVARAMAEGARRATTADLAVSVTGVAGPERDERGNAVGTVFIGFSTPEETVAERFDFGEKSRAEIRALSAEEALKLLEEKMKEV